MTLAPSEARRAAGCPDENQLALLAEGAIADADRAAIDRHLDGCAACTRLVAELAGLAAPARSVPDRYRIIRQLGAGAMGVVWEAEDTHLKRNVALKFVRPEGAADRERRSRLFREARALAQLRHPNVVTVHDVGQVGDRPDDEVFLAIELVIGTNAREWRDAAPRTTAEILAVWGQAAAGIAAVHRAGLVHRDIKPDNVLVSADGRVLVGDFGLATGELVESATALTQTGAVIGTPLYMAYEQLMGEPASSRTDQFALCVSIWEALVGERPFPGATIAAIATAMTAPPELPPRRLGDRHVFAALARGLLPDPDKRWPDVDALIAALARPAPTRARWLAVGAAGLAAAATATIWVATRTERGAPAVSESIVARPGPPAPATPPAPTTTTTIVGTIPPASEQAAAANEAPPAVPEAAGAGVAKGRHTQAAAKITPPPIPVLPPPARVPARQAPWHRQLTAATDKLQVGDGAGCLQLLAAIDPVPANQAEIAQTLRASCMMAAGDCVGGRAALAAYGATQGWDPARIERAVNGMDLMHCAIDASPRSRMPVRAEARLASVTATKRSCKPVLEAIQKHKIVMPDAQKAAQLEAACLVNDGDCEGARAAFLRAYRSSSADPAAARLETWADQQFPKTYPRCK